MAVQIITNGNLTLGGAVIEASDGTKLAMLIEGSSYSLYSDIDGTPNQEDTDTAVTVHGDAGSAVGYVHAAIDSSDDVHIIAENLWMNGVRDVAYCIATYSGGSWTFGTWEAALASYTQSHPTYEGAILSLDSNDDPHVLFMDRVKMQGTTADNVYYTEKTGASWATPTQIGDRGVKSDVYYRPKMTLRNSDYIEAYYFNASPDWDPKYKANVGSGWPAESGYAETFSQSDAILATTAGTVYRYYRSGLTSTSIRDIEENGVDTGYDTKDGYDEWDYHKVSASLVDDSARYVFYIDSGDDVHLISNNGGGWVDEGDLQVGTYDHVIAEWAYNNENQELEINYIFEASGTVYYDSFSLAVRRVFITHV